MAHKPTAAEGSLREWRISIMREKVHYLGRVIAPDKEAAIDRETDRGAGRVNARTGSR